jgi:hypothetical protein
MSGIIQHYNQVNTPGFHQISGLLSNFLTRNSYSSFTDPAASVARCPSALTAFSLQAPTALVIATLIIFTPPMVPEVAGQTVVTRAIGSQTVPDQALSLLPLVAQGRWHPSYQFFARHLALPVITVTNMTTLEIDGKVEIDASRLDQLTQTQKETLSRQFDVPVGIINNLLVGRTNQPPMDATQVAGQLCVTVTDYKYLLERWRRYLPPNGNEKVKADALLALETGDLDKAWRMFMDLPRPKPPASVRIAGPD